MAFSCATWKQHYGFSMAIQVESGDVLEEQHPTYRIFRNEDETFVVECNCFCGCTNSWAQSPQLRIPLFDIQLHLPTPPLKGLQMQQRQRKEWKKWTAITHTSIALPSSHSIRLTHSPPTPLECSQHDDPTSAHLWWRSTSQQSQGWTDVMMKTTCCDDYFQSSKICLTPCCLATTTMWEWEIRFRWRTHNRVYYALVPINRGWITWGARAMPWRPEVSRN